MKIAELAAPHQFRLIEGCIPDPGPGEVQARVRAVGVCGSDVHYYAEGGIGDIACKYPMVLGHEPTGEIVKVGPGVTGWSVGDKAVLEPALYCYHCEYCLTGHHNVCANIKFLSMPEYPGFLREFVNLPASNVMPMPANLNYAESTLFEPLAIILHSFKFGLPVPGDDAAVYGCGPIGLLTVAMLKIAGCRRIFAVEPVAERRGIAKEMGADVVIDPSQTNPVIEILNGTGRRGVDLAIDCAAKGESMNQAIRSIRPAGRFVVTAIPSEARVSLDFHVMRRNEIHMYNVRRSNHETDRCLDLLREKPALFGPLVTHTRDIEKVDEGYHICENYLDGVGKMVITV